MQDSKDADYVFLCISLFGWTNCDVSGGGLKISHHLAVLIFFRTARRLVDFKRHGLKLNLIKARARIIQGQPESSRTSDALCST